MGDLRTALQQYIESADKRLLEGVRKGIISTADAKKAAQMLTKLEEFAHPKGRKPQ
jgi:hypothetical protein